MGREGGRGMGRGVSQKVLWIEDWTGSLLWPPQQTWEVYKILFSLWHVNLSSETKVSHWVLTLGISLGFWICSVKTAAFWETLPLLDRLWQRGIFSSCLLLTPRNFWEAMLQSLWWHSSASAPNSQLSREYSSLRNQKLEQNYEDRNRLVRIPRWTNIFSPCH